MNMVLYTHQGPLTDCNKKPSLEKQLTCETLSHYVEGGGQKCGAVPHKEEHYILVTPRSDCKISYQINSPIFNADFVQKVALSLHVCRRTVFLACDDNPE